jgi:hypothetical protein
MKDRHIILLFIFGLSSVITGILTRLPELLIIGSTLLFSFVVHGIGFIRFIKDGGDEP